MRLQLLNSKSSENYVMRVNPWLQPPVEKPKNMLVISAQGKTTINYVCTSTTVPAIYDNGRLGELQYPANYKKAPIEKPAKDNCWPVGQNSRKSNRQCPK